MGFWSMLEATHPDDVVHMDVTLRIIDNFCEYVTQESLNCLVSTLSSSEVEMAISRHSGCRTWT